MTAPTPAGHLIEQATRQLAAAGSSSPRLDAQLLLGHVTGWSRSTVLAHPELVVEPAQAQAFGALVARRAACEPMAYLLGEREFYGRSFRVDRRALIPRPETELLVQIGIDGVGRWRAAGVDPVVVDVGTGSGAVAVTVAAETGARVVASDVSWEALVLAGENADLHGAARHVVRIQCDLLAGVRGPLHVVLANLPYVPTGQRLPRDVGDYEPSVALYGGPAGTELIERLLQEAGPLLAPGGEIALELDERGQAQRAEGLARAVYPSAETQVRLDAGGYERALWLRL